MEKVFVNKCIILFLALVTCSESQTNNVCKRLSDYSHPDNNPNCWYDADIPLPAHQIPERYGLPFKQYTVVTEDGYILKLFRIPHNGNNINQTRTPIILAHGFTMSSDLWLFHGNNSAGIVLAKEGYDVWLLNFRGTQYSQDHVKYSSYGHKYWDFSFDEMGLYDLPAIVKLVAKESGQKGNIFYLGHSMGSTAAYIYASTRPQHAKTYLKKILTAAPAVYFKEIGVYQDGFIKPAKYLLQLFEIFPMVNIFSLVQKVCQISYFTALCDLTNNIAQGVDFIHSSPERYKRFYNKFPAPVSIKCGLHFMQCYFSGGQFRQYDHGRRRNLEKYGTVDPPSYNISQIQVPIHILYGENDQYVRPKNVLKLYTELKTSKNITKIFHNGSPVDHIMKDIDAKICEVIIEIIKNS